MEILRFAELRRFTIVIILTCFVYYYVFQGPFALKDAILNFTLPDNMPSGRYKLDIDGYFHRNLMYTLQVFVEIAPSLL